MATRESQDRPSAPIRARRSLSSSGSGPPCRPSAGEFCRQNDVIGALGQTSNSSLPRAARPPTTDAPNDHPPNDRRVAVSPPTGPVAFPARLSVDALSIAREGRFGDALATQDARARGRVGGSAPRRARRARGRAPRLEPGGMGGELIRVRQLSWLALPIVVDGDDVSVDDVGVVPRGVGRGLAMAAPKRLDDAPVHLRGVGERRCGNPAGG